MTLRFTKMHGAANDYIYVDGFAQRDLLALLDLPKLSIAIAHRHRGVGADGLIAIVPPEPGVDAHVRMRMFNADGSESEMCGNGIRCVAKFSHDRGLSKAKPIRVQTGAGVLSIDYTTNGDGKVNAATVDMGEPILEASRIPAIIAGVAPAARIVDQPLRETLPGVKDPHWQRDCGWDELISCVSMGNPHVVLYCADVRAVPMDRVGPAIETLPMFPRRVNVHFVQVRSKGELTMRTWERGSGITQACGTGACAVCVAGVLAGRSGRDILAHLPGGDLALRWDEKSNHVFMTGEAVEICDGEWNV